MYWLIPFSSSSPLFPFKFCVLQSNKSALNWTCLCQVHFNPMEQYALKCVNNCLNTNIYSNWLTSGGQSSNLYLNVLFSTLVLIRHPWQLKTVVFLQLCLKHAFLLCGNLLKFHLILSGNLFQLHGKQNKESSLAMTLKS